MDFEYGPLLIFLVGLVCNGILAIPLINFLYKLKFRKTKQTKNVDVSKRNPLYYKHLFKRMDTPSSFGILLIPNLLLYHAFVQIDGLLSFTLALLYFGLLGLYDDFVKYFKYEQIQKWGLGAIPKLTLQFLGVVILMCFGNLPMAQIVMLSIFVVFIINAYNFTDGLDGLVGTLSIYILPVLIYFEYRTTNDQAIVTLLTFFFSFLCVFVYFNIKPARVFLGDVGSMMLGFLIGAIGVRYTLLPVLVLLSLIIIEGLSSCIQLIFLRLFNRKVFLIAPYHLHLLNKGWEDTKIVQRAGVIQLVLSLLALYLFSIGL